MPEGIFSLDVTQVELLQLAVFEIMRISRILALVISGVQGKSNGLKHRPGLIIGSCMKRPIPHSLVC